MLSLEFLAIKSSLLGGSGAPATAYLRCFRWFMKMVEKGPRPFGSTPGGGKVEGFGPGGRLQRGVLNKNYNDLWTIEK